MNKLFNLLLAQKIIWINHGLAINYEKVEKDELLRHDVGYNNITTVADRYNQSSISTSIESSLQETAVKDNLYFLEKRCSSMLASQGSRQH